MSAQTQPPTPPWEAAVQRASSTMDVHHFGGMDDTCWDDVSMRGIIATVLYALHLRDQQPVDTIRWQSVLWHLRDDDRVTTLVTAGLPGAGHDLARAAAGGDPAADCWRWLTRTWDPGAPTQAPAPAGAQGRGGMWVPQTAEPRWGGLSRGIGRGLPDPAIEVCTPWARNIAEQALITSRSGRHRDDRVEVTSGPLAGHRGYVLGPAWDCDDTTETVDGPVGYLVDLDDTEEAEHIQADALTACHDACWPHRPPGTLKAAPPQRPQPDGAPATCAEDLAGLLKRAANPRIVPGPLRTAIAAARQHHHLQLDWQARPHPDRVTWRVRQHWYQLTENSTDDQRAEVFEVVVTRHLHDPAPVHYLTLSETDLPDLIARHTAQR